MESTPHDVIAASIEENSIQLYLLAVGISPYDMLSAERLVHGHARWRSATERNFRIGS